ncbi:MAG: anion permease [bacterium JZ-2024 1]
MGQETASVIVIVALAWLYDLFNGMNDAANAIATSICTRALSPAQAIVLARSLNFVGALLGTAVAKTIANIVAPEYATLEVMIAGLLGAIIWSWLCTYYGIPISITHSLIAGLGGAAITAGGPHAVQWNLVGKKIFVGLIVSPVAGLVGGFLMMLLVIWVFQRTSVTLSSAIFRRGQVLSAGYVALSHGFNDTQNAMGVITSALLSAGKIATLEVSLWVKAGSAFFMALGTSIGGWRVIKTLGMRLTHLEPPQGFCAETAAATTMYVSSLFGLPISTTHAISTSLMGAGAVRRLSAVRWGVGAQIVLTWVFTIPGAAGIAALMYFIVR